MAQQVLFSSKSNLTLSARVSVTGHNENNSASTFGVFVRAILARSKRLNLNVCEG